jgi:collagenase-like PrtC family protease
MNVGALELVCPAGNLAALQAAVDNGADAVYVGLRDGTNARNFAGLNFSQTELERAVAHAHARGAKVYVAINTYAQPDAVERWCRAVDCAADLGADAILAADMAVLDYAARSRPSLHRHLSVQGSATTYEAINLFVREFGVSRAVLPRVLTLAQVAQVAAKARAQIEVFGFGSLCVMVEGRCALSSYVTGQSPNTAGVCSPAAAVRWQQGSRGLESRLNGVLVDCYAEHERAAYPTLCKGRYAVGERTHYAIEEPASLNTLELLPRLAAAGVKAVKIEGRQRSAAYVAEVTRVWRAAIDALERDRQPWRPRADWLARLDALAEGSQHTFGAYERPWK